MLKLKQFIQNYDLRTLFAKYLLLVLAPIISMLINNMGVNLYQTIMSVKVGIYTSSSPIGRSTSLVSQAIFLLLALLFFRALWLFLGQKLLKNGHISQSKKMIQVILFLIMAVVVLISLIPVGLFLAYTWLVITGQCQDGC